MTPKTCRVCVYVCVVTRWTIPSAPVVSTIPVVVVGSGGGIAPFLFVRLSVSQPFQPSETSFMASSVLMIDSS